MVVFLIMVIAFSDAFYTESNAQSDPYLGNFFEALMFSYSTALGGLDTEVFHGFVAWTLFFGCTVFNLIMLLNLLIAIISETYDNVTATRQQYAMLQLV